MNTSLKNRFLNMCVFLCVSRSLESIAQPVQSLIPCVRVGRRVALCEPVEAEVIRGRPKSALI